MRRHRILLAAVVAMLATLLPTVAAGARPVDDTPPSEPRSAPGTRIAGGSPATIEDFPFQAAIFYGGAFRCGGTVISKSWVLTAAHCLYGPPRRIADKDIVVVTGTTLLSAGGEQRRVQASYIHPSFVHSPDLGDDVALLRLRQPTWSPAVSVIGSSPAELALDDAGTNATAIGWGALYDGGGAVNQLRRATVPITTDANCATAYPSSDPEGYVFNPSTMVCAGRPNGGIDACQGDSGGPLLAAAPDGWRQVGVTSWGRGCARSGSPGVYSRLTSSQGWIASTRRFGPFAPDGLAFIDRQMRDFYGRPANANELANWSNLLQAQPPSSLILTRANGSIWQNSTDPIARLHKVAMGTYPTTTAYNNWVPQRRRGVSVASIAPWFAAGRANLTDAAYVEAIYANAMGQAPSAGTRAVWIIRLGNGSWSRGDMLVYFSESTTARSRLRDGVQVSSTWYGMMRLGPNDTTVAAHTPLSQVALIDLLLNSYSYSYRFRS